MGGACPDGMGWWAKVGFVQLDVPTSSGQQLTISPLPGHPIVVVGPNGSGKSALSAYLQTRAQVPVNRIFAHRRIWLNSAAPELPAADLLNWVQSFAHWDVQPQSRWREQNEQARLSSIINDVLNRQNYVDGLIGEAVRKGQSLEQIQTQGPLQVLNTILESSGLNINIGVGENGGLVCTGRGGSRYSAAEMSDGERAALLLASDVLVAPKGTLHLVDEPERHLHRSISASLITSLIEERSSDSFVVFTHDLELAQFLGRTGESFVLTGCTWEGQTPSTWQIERLSDSEPLRDDVRRAILGGRRRVLFHEGTQGGLDQELYEALLRDWSVMPVGGCSVVLRSVAGLSALTNLHWLEVSGIVDKDFRRTSTPDKVVKLKVHEVENVFYSAAAIEFMARAQAESLGEDPRVLADNAYSAMRSALTEPNVRAHILRQRATQMLRDQLSDQALSVTSSGDNTVSLTATIDHDTMAQDFDRFVAGIGPIDDFLREFPIRESGARRAATKELLFRDPALYEGAVIHRVRGSTSFRSEMRRAAGLESLA